MNDYGNNAKLAESIICERKFKYPKEFLMTLMHTSEVTSIQYLQHCHPCRPFPEALQSGSLYRTATLVTAAHPLVFHSGRKGEFLVKRDI